MDFFSDIVEGAGAVAGGLAGAPAGIAGSFFGGKAGGATANALNPWGNRDPNNPLSFLGGMPEYPTYAAPGAFKASEAAQVNFGDVNRDALDKLKGIGMSEGESPWAVMQRANLERESGLGADQLRANAAQGLNSGMSAIAAGQGLTGGASERMANASNAAMQEQLQRLGANKAGASSQIGLQDYEQKLGILKGLPGQELAYAEPGMREALANAGYQQQTNLANAGGENQYNLGSAAQQNAFNQANYGAQLGAWGNMANAQAIAANKPKGFVEQLLPWNWF